MREVDPPRSPHYRRRPHPMHRVTMSEYGSFVRSAPTRTLIGSMTSRYSCTRCFTSRPRARHISRSHSTRQLDPARASRLHCCQTRRRDLACWLLHDPTKNGWRTTRRCSSCCAASNTIRIPTRSNATSLLSRAISRRRIFSTSRGSCCLNNRRARSRRTRPTLARWAASGSISAASRSFETA